jgi:ribosomal protein L15
MTVSTSLHAGTVEAVRSRVGKRGFSSYVEAALRRQIEHDNLAELIDEYTESEGAFTADELAAARTALYGAERPSGGHAT